jgi:hypothetical protein
MTQIPILSIGLVIGHWSSEFIWDLEIEIWNLKKSGNMKNYLSNFDESGDRR